MTPERYAQISQLFHAALERAPAERAAFLAQACVDDQALRGEVESLLAAGAQAGDFIAAPALQDAAQMLAEEPAPSLAGKRLSHYQVLSLLGAGGMGEVYRAQDTKLDRLVALKILPLALATNNVWSSYIRNTLRRWLI